MEKSGVITTRRLGTVRIVELNRRYPEHADLVRLLLRLSERPVYAARWTESRRRPRAMGKPLR
ncbi:MAG: hypothetical protein JO347_13050 [Candidatus Eremiobacteraeota bacterium]|nr:hypothetical protein [Candidatus Eremiobacteraeota bacterium]